MGKDKKPAPDTIYRGTKTLPDSIYEGELVNDLRHGHGSCRWTNGDIYEGYWKADKRNGYGILRLSETKDRYEGNWKDGKADGYGVMAWAAGTRFEGMWRENKRSGFGRFFYPDGVTYEGMWLENKRHGQGILSWPDGSIYSGRFTDDKIEGSGRYFPTEAALEKVWFMTSVPDFPAVALKEYRRRKLVASGAGSPLLGTGGSPLSHHDGLRVECTVKSLLSACVQDPEDLSRYYASLHESGHDNMVALKAKARSEADLRTLGISKPVHAKKVLNALEEKSETDVLPPSHPLLHHYLYSLFEMDSVEDERLLAYVTSLSEGMGLTRTEELALVEEADIENMDMLEGHKAALLFCKRNMGVVRKQFRSPLSSSFAAPRPPAEVASPPPPPPSTSGAVTSPVTSEQESNRMLMVGELRDALMAMKSKQPAIRRPSIDNSDAGPMTGTPLKATSKTGEGGPQIYL